MLKNILKKCAAITISTIICLSTPVFANEVSTNTLRTKQQNLTIGTFSFSNIDNGVVTVQYVNPTDKKVKLLVEKEETAETYSYDLLGDGVPVNFPLQMGNGIYKISVLQHKQDNLYTYVESVRVNLVLKDGVSLYLNSTQNINWSKDDLIIQKAKLMTENAKTNIEKAKILQNYIATLYSYDYDKTVTSGYLPNINETFETKKGICYDFASLYASMLRSVGVPTKLIMGYSNNAEGYHSWNEVFDEVNKQWIVVDTTYDVSYYKLKKQVNFDKNLRDYSEIKKVY